MIFACGFNLLILSKQPTMINKSQSNLSSGDLVSIPVLKFSEKHSKTSEECIGEYPNIPIQAFLYFPSSSDPDVVSGYKKQTKRFIFGGDIPFSEFENQKLDALQKALDNKQIELPSFWDLGLRLRFLQSTQYDIKETIQEIKRHTEFRLGLKNFTVSSKVKKYLNEGIFYFCGRDYKYRPIVVTDLSRMLHSKITADDFKELMTYYMEFLVNNTLIPGQVQNFIQLFNMGAINPLKLIDVIKDAIIYLTNHYKARNYKAYLVNPPSGMSFFWGMAKQFLNEDQKSKVVFHGGMTADKLFHIADPSQVERKFGGTMPDITEFWPVKQAGPQYQTDKKFVHLISKDEYRTKFEKGELTHRLICKQLVDETKLSFLQADLSITDTARKGQTSRITMASQNTAASQISLKNSRVSHDSVCRTTRRKSKSYCVGTLCHDFAFV